MPQVDASTVAWWMLKEFEREDFLDHFRAAVAIADEFGTEFTHLSAHGNLVIDQKVLHRFRRLTGDVVVWSRSERHWRRRLPGDAPGRFCP